MHKLVWDFEIQMDHLISARQPDLVIINKKKGNSWIVNFAALVDHRVKIKESKKRDEYLDLAREFKNYGTWRWQWNQLGLVHLEQSPKGW